MVLLFALSCDQMTQGTEEGALMVVEDTLQAGELLQWGNVTHVCISYLLCDPSQVTYPL